MPVRRYKPTSPGRRKSSVDTFEDITKKTPERSLVSFRKKHSGRSRGTISVRHKGGGERRLYRHVDFKQDLLDIPGKVIAIEYDPNRGARLALVEYPGGQRRYMLAPVGMIVGTEVLSSTKRVEPKIGNRMPLADIPEGIAVHNIELTPGAGGILVRGAGVGAELMAIEGNHAQLRLPSGEVRLVLKQCRATVGMVGNTDRRLIRWGKAGRMRHRGIRPTVRGKAMNPIDHPHGGGEGSHPVGMKAPKTLWGKKALGVKTRKPHKWSNRFIISSRKRARGLSS